MHDTGMTAGGGMFNEQCPMFKENPMTNDQAKFPNLRLGSERARLGRCNVRTASVQVYSDVIVYSGIAAGGAPALRERLWSAPVSGAQQRPKCKRARTLARLSERARSADIPVRIRARPHIRADRNVRAPSGWDLDIGHSLVIGH